MVIRNVFKCMDKNKCGKTRVYYRTKDETKIEEKLIMSKYGGREIKTEVGMMFSTPGEGLESGGGCTCEPLGPLPPGLYQQ